MGADNFSDAALSDESRGRFAKSAIELIEAHALDGIDLDWEYPGQPGPGIKFRPEDKHNFTLMLAALRKQFDARGRADGRHYLLTIASADREYFDHTEMDVLHVYLDWINIMAYDFYNSLTKTTGHHAGLYKAAEAPDDSRWGDASVRQHLAAGIPPQKLCLGVPFYGRAFGGVEGGDDPVNQPYAKYTGADSYPKLASDYVNKNGFVRRWDKVAQAPYLWNEQTRTFISYDDPQSLKVKAEYVKKMNLGGMMYWEQSHDPDGELLRVLYDNLRE